MAAACSYVAQNTTQRDRLRRLVGKLTSEELQRPLEGGRTVAGVLAHLAFWDQRVLFLIERWERGGPGAAPTPIHPEDDDWINDAVNVLALALPPRTAAKLAVTAAEAVDRKAAALASDLMAANEAAGTPIGLLRAKHRIEHLDEIERALKR